jgi:hypothetical protein
MLVEFLDQHNQQKWQFRFSWHVRDEYAQQGEFFHTIMIWNA